MQLGIVNFGKDKKRSQQLAANDRSATANPTSGGLAVCAPYNKIRRS
jgi:hypothetical protein